MQLRFPPLRLSLITLALATLILGSSGRLSAQSPTPVQAQPVIPDASSDPQARSAPQLGEPAFARDLDPARVALLARLTRFNSGEHPRGEPIQDLFSVELTNPQVVAKRVAELEIRKRALEKRLAEITAQQNALAEAALSDRRDAASRPVLPSSDSVPLSTVTQRDPANIPLSDGAAVPADSDVQPTPPPKPTPASTSEGQPTSLGALASVDQTEAQKTESVRIALAEEARAARLKAEAEAEFARSERNASRTRETERLRNETEVTRLDLEIATQRLAYLSALSASYAKMTDAAIRILPSLGAARTSMREHAQTVGTLGVASQDLAKRIDVLRERSESGLLVGFISERRELSEISAALAASLTSQANQFESIHKDLNQLAESIESEGASLRSSLLRKAVEQDRGDEIDALFLEHLRTQRRLRKSVSQVLATPGQQALEALRLDLRATAAAPNKTATTAGARALLETTSDLRDRLTEFINAEVASRDGWQLAFENEVVTVLSEHASADARNDAYGFSTEIVGDIQAELSLAWNRLLAEADRRRAEIPSAASIFSTDAGKRYLQRAAGLLLLLGIWIVLSRQAARFAVIAVKNLARLSAVRGRIGLFVRWFGLVETILPTVIAFIALRIATHSVLDPDSEIARLIRVLVVPFLWYVLGRQALVGATRRIARGRPALIEIRQATLARLEKTYATLGLVVAIGWVLDGIARIGIGVGLVVTLVDAAVLAWVGVWAAWEAIHWRVPLAEGWLALLPTLEDEGRKPSTTTPDPTRPHQPPSSKKEEASTSEAIAATKPTLEHRAAQFMGSNQLGFLLSPIALLNVIGKPIFASLANLATKTSMMQSLRARLLRRRSKKVDLSDDPDTKTLPADYLEAFPLHPVLGEDDALLVPREDILKEVTAQIDRWRETRADGSLALIGEKGVGKTTLAALIGMRAHGLERTHHTIRGKPGTRREFLENLSASFPNMPCGDLDELRAALNAGPERIVLVDEAHNVFLRRVDGYEAYDALVELVNGTSSKVFWVLIFNSFTWRFLNESRGRVHYFRRLLMLPSWSPEDIQKLIRLRNKRTGYDLEFDAMLLSDDKAGNGSLELVEESDGYFRLLWESSGGNPRIATQRWLHSLRPAGEKRLRVGLFREPSAEVLSALQDDLLFALAAICQHENLSGQELAIVLNVPESVGLFSILFLSESGFIEPKDADAERYTLAPKYDRAVLRALKKKHLLFD